MDGFVDMTAAKAAAATSSAKKAREKTENSAVASESLPFILPNQIPPRPWAYGNFLMFGQAAVIGAVDGGGKGAIAVAMALAMITGEPLLEERVWRRGPVAIISYEDDTAEWHRRIAAACIHYHLDYEFILGNVRFIVKRPSGRISFGTMIEGAITSDREKIVAELDLFKPALVIVDPFNHAHHLDDGNNNAMVARVAGEMMMVAKETDAAVLVLHHLRKGSVGSPDDLMGATSLRATLRSSRILARMAPDVAEKMEIKDPWRYIRVAGSKENYAPPPERAKWYRLASVQLGNGTDDYPDGDSIAVATPWQARPMFEGMDATALGKVFEKLRSVTHGPARQAKHTPWAGKPLEEIGGRSPREAAKIITAWMESGVLIKGEYLHAESKNKVARVTLDDAKASAIMAEIRAPDVAPG